MWEACTMKDLLKPGRDLKEYLNEDGTLQRHCLTCIHRNTSKEFIWGGWLCSSDSLRDLCNPTGCQTQHFYWEPRVDINTFLSEEDFNL